MKTHYINSILSMLNGEMDDELDFLIIRDILENFDLKELAKTHYTVYSVHKALV